jgi:predicted metal-binding protein
MSNVSLKTNVIGMRELIARFRFPEKIMEFCKACPIYGRNWSCPPFSFDVDELLGRYNCAYLFGIKMTHGDAARTSINTGGAALKYSVWLMDNVNLKMLSSLHDLERKYPGSRGASGGSCKICRTCARTEERPCRFPGKMRNSIESLGFDVMKISEELLGLKLLWMRDALPQYQVLINALFTKDRHDDIIY